MAPLPIWVASLDPVEKDQFRESRKCAEQASGRESRRSSTNFRCGRHLGQQRDQPGDRCRPQWPAKPSDPRTHRQLSARRLACPAHTARQVDLQLAQVKEKGMRLSRRIRYYIMYGGEEPDISTDRAIAMQVVVEVQQELRSSPGQESISRNERLERMYSRAFQST